LGVIAGKERLTGTVGAASSSASGGGDGRDNRGVLGRLGHGARAVVKSRPQWMEGKKALKTGVLDKLGVRGGRKISAGGRDVSVSEEGVCSP